MSNNYKLICVIKLELTAEMKDLPSLPQVYRAISVDKNYFPNFDLNITGITGELAEETEE